MLPVMLDVSGKKCVIIGGGRAAARKAKTLIENGADVTVISERACDDFDGMAVRFIKKQYSADDISDCFIAVAATDSGELNRRIKEDAKDRARLFMSADSGASDMAFTAYARSGDVTAAVSTGGAYPLLGVRVSNSLKVLCEKTDEKAKILKSYRKRILESNLNGEEKREILNALVSEEMLNINDIGLFKENAERILEERL